MSKVLGGDHKEALATLSSKTTLQFDYLDTILRPDSAGEAGSGEGAESEVGPGAGVGSGALAGQRGVLHTLQVQLDEGLRSLHMRLLIRFRPYEVYPFLATHQRYSLDDTLALCQQRGVVDATAYLLERKGDITGALALALRTLTSRLSKLRNSLHSVNLWELTSGGTTPGAGAGAGAGARGTRLVAIPPPQKNGGSGGSGGSRLRVGSRAWTEWAGRVVLEGVEEGREASRSLAVAIEMCQRASPPAGVWNARGISKGGSSPQGLGAGKEVVAYGLTLFSCPPLIHLFFFLPSCMLWVKVSSWNSRLKLEVGARGQMRLIGASRLGGAFKAWWCILRVFVDKVAQGTTLTLIVFSWCTLYLTMCTQGFFLLPFCFLTLLKYRVHRDSVACHTGMILGLGLG
ncbi:unnamed protein product [Discosporangium mesarthrocarpum]